MIHHKRNANINIDIGLSVLCAVSRRDETLSLDDIAEVCSCSRNAIFEIEKRAMQKLKIKFNRFNRDDFLG